MTNNKISLYIPPNRPIFDVVAQLKEEAGRATAIADDTTRTSVMNGLVSILGKIDKLDKVPDNGIVLFAESDNVRVIMPNKPLDIKAYYCDDVFHEEHLPKDV